MSNLLLGDGSIRCARRSVLAWLISASFNCIPRTVPRGASETEIRKAYKKFSRKYHPDKNKDEGAEDKFVEIAYGVFLLFIFHMQNRLKRVCSI